MANPAYGEPEESSEEGCRLRQADLLSAEPSNLGSTDLSLYKRAKIARRALTLPTDRYLQINLL